MNQTELNEIYKVAFDEGRRRLDHQDSEMSLGRARLIQVTSVVIGATAFLAGAALPGLQVTGWRFAAVNAAAALGSLLFVALMIVVYRAIRPIDDWIVETSPRVIIQDYAEGSPPADLGATYRDIALYFDRYSDANATHLQRLSADIKTAYWISGTEIVVWVAIAWFAASG